MAWTIQGLKRGVLEAFSGIALVLQNPRNRQQKFLRIFIYLSIFSFVLITITNIAIGLPIYILRFIVSIVPLVSHDAARSDRLLVIANRFIRDLVTTLSFLALFLMRYIYPKPLDDLFIEQLRYIDSLNPERPPYASSLSQRKYRQEYWNNMKGFIFRSWKKLRLGILLSLLSLLPVVGRFVFPAAGAYITFRSLGRTQGIAVGICFLFLPRSTTISLIRALIGMRALMREFLEPYFVRMSMSHKEKRRWFSGKKDVLFGFSAIAYLLIRIPIIGFLGFGVAQAASAYMLTVVADPPSVSTTDLDETSAVTSALSPQQPPTQPVPRKPGSETDLPKGFWKKYVSPGANHPKDAPQ